MMFLFEERVFETPVGQRAAMIITPAAHLRIDETRRADPGEGLGSVDAEILAQGELRAQRVELAIFRGRDDHGLGSWAFADHVSDAAARRLARTMLESHLHLYRGLMKAGLCLYIHVEWGARELEAFRAVTEDKLAELEAQVGDRDDLDDHPGAIDIWILRNLVFYFSVSLDKLLGSILPDKLPLMQKRIKRIQRTLRASKA